MIKLYSAVLTIALLAACGGGGGNPGQCNGSAEVCGLGNSSGSSSTSGISVGISPDTSTTVPPITVTCSVFVYQEDAQAFFNANNARQLDADNDGIACEELPRRPLL